MADIKLATTNCNPPTDMPDSLDGVVVTVPTSSLGNNDTSFFYFDLLKAGFNIFSVEFTIVATTLTFEGTNDLPSVSDASADWRDLTDVLTISSPGGAVSTITATGTLTVSFPFPWSRMRIRRLTTNATNSLSIKLTRGRVN